MIDLKEKLKKIIEQETERKHFCVIGSNGMLEKSVELINKLFENYEKVNDLKQDFSNLPKQGELILLVAPTGAGKDSVVIRLNSKNLEKNYIELNIDMFRHYFPIFIPDSDELTDITFAKKTNEFSYEIYITIQEIILQEFPGTNVIITGTLRENDWIEESIKKYKQNKNTNYKVKILSLAVPENESEMSSIKRYISIVDDQLNNNPEFIPGTARYTSKKYHDETYERFPDNLLYFEKKFKETPGKLIDAIEVYRRSKIINDYEENTLVYSSERDNNKTAVMAVNELREKKAEYNIDEIEMLLDVTIKNSSYLISQDTYSEIILAFLRYVAKACEKNKNVLIKNKSVITKLLYTIDSTSKYLKIDQSLEEIISNLAESIGYTRNIIK